MSSNCFDHSLEGSPPATARFSPVMYLASSEQTKEQTPEMSSTSPILHKFKILNSNQLYGNSEYVFHTFSRAASARRCPWCPACPSRWWPWKGNHFMALYFLGESKCFLVRTAAKVVLISPGAMQLTLIPWRYILKIIKNIYKRRVSLPAAPTLRSAPWLDQAWRSCSQNMDRWSEMQRKKSLKFRKIIK